MTACPCTIGLDDLADLPPRPPVTEDAAVSFEHFLRGSDLAAPPPTVRNVLHHYATGWERQALPNVGLFHYADLRADLAGELLRLASLLGIDLPHERAGVLAARAGLDAMRRDAAAFAPNATDGYWDDPSVFFRSGTGGEWRTLLAPAQLSEYRALVAELAAPGLAAWAQAGRGGGSTG